MLTMNNLKTTFSLAVFVFTSPLYGALSDDLEAFASYKTGQAKAALHQARLAAYKDSHNSPERHEVEKQLLSFLKSEAENDAKHYVCLWLGDLGSKASLPLLEELSKHPELADVAMIAQSEIQGSWQLEARRGDSSKASDLSRIEKSSSPAKDIINLIESDDPERVRLGFEACRLGLGSGEVQNWFVDNLTRLTETRQILALNTLKELRGPAYRTYTQQCARKGLTGAKLQALSLLRWEDDIDFLIENLGEAEEYREAAMVSLSLMPREALAPVIERTLQEENSDLKSAMIEVIHRRGDGVASRELWSLAQGGSSLAKPAIRALGASESPDRARELLSAFIASEGQPLNGDWKMATWNLMRRHPNPKELAGVIQKAGEGASPSMSKVLMALSKKVQSLGRIPSLTSLGYPAKATKN
jgi:HEAT repeat protein